MNDTSRYTVVIKWFNKDNCGQLQEFFFNYLTDALLEEQANPDVIDQYIKNAGTFEFVRNTDRQYNKLKEETAKVEKIKKGFAEIMESEMGTPERAPIRARTYDVEL